MALKAMNKGRRGAPRLMMTDRTPKMPRGANGRSAFTGGGSNSMTRRRGRNSLDTTLASDNVRKPRTDRTLSANKRENKKSPFGRAYTDRRTKMKTIST